MQYSVIIPAWNSAATLPKLMEDLQRQTYSPAQVIVADGQSSDDTVAIARRFGVEVVDNPVRHAAGGRNRGAAQARGEWLAFTDSDCQLQADWLERANQVIQQNPDLVALAGPMLALPPRNYIEQIAGDAFLGGVMQFPREAVRVRDRRLRGAFITANVFYRKDVFDAVGGFDEWFETNAEDIDLFWRVLAHHPGQLLYDPAIPVYHCFPTTMGGLYRKWYGFGIASCRLQKRHFGAVHVDGSHYRRLGAAVWAYARFPAQRSNNQARIVQIVGHLSGKYMGSLKFGIINL